MNNTDFRCLNNNKNNEFFINFKIAKHFSRICGIISAIQSIIWIGFSILGIAAHYCIFNYEITVINLETITKITFFELYFNYNCNGNRLTNDTSGANYLDFVKNKTILNSTYIHNEMWLYLGLSTLWFLSSIPLITLIDEKHLRRTIILIYLWILITLIISVFDVGSGVIFSLDYNEFRKIAGGIGVNNEYNLYSMIINSALISSSVMFVMSFRGFILWILNFCSLTYLFVVTFKINGAKFNNIASGNINNTNDDRFVHPILTRQPIRAYENNNASNNVNSEQSVQLNVEPLERAYQMSVESLKERHNNGGGYLNAGFSKFEQGHVNTRIMNEPIVPDPDYTPPMQRAFVTNSNSNNNSNNNEQKVWKNKRFQ